MKKCLIIVDYQHDFVEGSLGFKEALTIGKTIQEKIKAYQTIKAPIIYTFDTHDADYLDTEEGKHLPIKHCIKGTPGHELHSSIQSLKQDHDLSFIKHTFPSLELGNYLKNHNFDEIELCGLVSNICVISNAIIAKAALPNAKILIDANATASFDQSLHEKALDIMESLHIHVTNRRKPCKN